MKIIAFLLAAALLLSACAVQPVSELPYSHPASPAAAEASSRPPGTNLARDESTRITEQLLAPPPEADHRHP